MPSLHRHSSPRFSPPLGVLFVLAGLSNIPFLIPQSAASEPLSPQIEQARSLAATSPREGLDLAQKAADAAEHTGDVFGELQARGLIIDILRVFGVTALDVGLYREQMTRLEVLVQQEEEPVRSKDRALLSILQAELALYLAENVEAVKLARAAIKQSESLEGTEIIRIAKVALGVALARGILLGFLDEAKIYKQAYGLIDPQAYNEPLALLTQGFEGKPLEGYQFLVTEGKKNLAFIYTLRNEHEKALALYREIEPPFSAPPVVRAQHLVGVANAELALKKQREAEGRLQVIWDLLHANPSETDQKVRAHALLGSWDAFLGAGQRERAELVFREGADILGKDSDGRRNLLVYLDRSIIPALEGRDESSLGAQTLEKTLSIPGIGDDPSIALPLLAKLGRFYARLLDYQKFAQVLQKAEVLHAKAPNWKAIQELWIQEATIRRYQDPTGTARAYRAAILAAGIAKDGRLDFELLFHGMRHAIILAMEIGRYQDAVDFALLGLTHLKTTDKDDPFEAGMELLIEAGRAMTKLGRFDLTEDALSLAVGLLPKVRVDWNQRIRLAASEFYSLIGDTEFSLYQLNLVKQFSIAEHIASSSPVLMRQRAAVLKQLGNYLVAEEALRACISLAAGPVIRQADAEMWCRWDLSRLLWEDLGEYKEGGEEYTKGRELSVASQDLFAMVEMNAHFIIRGLLQGYLKSEPAIELSRNTIDKLQRLPATARVNAYLTMAHLTVLFAQKKMGDEKLDWAPFDASLNTIITEPYVSIREYEYLMIIGRTLKAMGENERALSVLNEVVKRIEYVRSLLTDPRLQIRLGSEVNELFDEIVAIYLDQRTHEGSVKALQFAEANRARSIRHFEEIGQETRDADESQGTIHEQARAKLERLRKGNSYLLTGDELKAASDLLTITLDQVEARPGVEGPKVRAPIISQSRLMRSLDLYKFRANLSPTAAVIMYHLTGGRAGAWVLTKESLQWTELGNLEKVQAGVLHYRSELLSGEPGSEHRLERAAIEAFDMLLGPLTSAIEGKTHLIIVPDASAFLIPFEALVISKGPDTGKYVIERYLVTYHMSLGHLIRNTETPTHQTEKARTVLLVGNPTFPPPVSSAGPQERAELVPLAGAQREIERIREVVAPTNLSVYMGDEARKERFQEQLRHTTVAHFATHGVLNERYPWSSYIALAGENGHLLLDELPRTPITADLVVLSACETGRGRILAGEGVWGFQSQFLSAGAKNVVASLWRVEDESTAEFIGEFYKEMGPELKRYANALRAAKLRLLRSDKWHHPYYWAPFVLYGQSPTS